MKVQDVITILDFPNNLRIPQNLLGMIKLKSDIHAFYIERMKERISEDAKLKQLIINEVQ